MTPMLLKAGVKQRKLNKLCEKLIMLNDEKSKEYLYRLEDLYNYQYRDVVDIYNLLKPDQWENYELLGITDQREQHLLKSALKILRLTFIREIQSNEEDNEEANSISPE